jgi:hypothetical protein
MNEDARQAVEDALKMFRKMRMQVLIFAEGVRFCQDARCGAFPGVDFAKVGGDWRVANRSIPRMRFFAFQRASWESRIRFVNQT